jgi:hypothetical protein
MYLRHTTRKKDGKAHRYWCLVRSVRVGRRVIQQTVAQLCEHLLPAGKEQVPWEKMAAVLVAANCLRSRTRCCCTT